MLQNYQISAQISNYNLYIWKKHLSAKTESKPSPELHK